ncbi:ADP-ribosyltransferase [Nocardia sp. SYP-A9097]|uniref:ADP-ribosyltransferase n=1 Tax=Nocardia sp. SYP-A9097 TaxID=2663237 RepID=UPI001890E6EB|nr:ADP-ribosyltransferase [Nocardia sp. SYP-A9097]
MTGDPRFNETPLAYTALAGQNLDLLTSQEREVISAYSGDAYRDVNRAMRGEITMTPPLARRIALIRSGLRRYPIDHAVRVSRIVDAAFFDITDDASVHAILGEEFVEPAFLSTSGLATPPPTGIRAANPVIVDMIVPRGTPALRLGEIAEVPYEREVLIIDARTTLPVGVVRDEARNMWRIQAIVLEGES